MPKATVSSVSAFLTSLPPERAKELRRVRKVIRDNLPSGYEETVRGSKIAYEVPLARYPDTYNGQPLCYAALAAPKTSLTLYLMPVYGSPELLRRLQDGFRDAGRKLDMGKACIHFKTANDLALTVIGEIVAAVPLPKWVAFAKAVRRLP